MEWPECRNINLPQLVRWAQDSHADAVLTLRQAAEYARLMTIAWRLSRRGLSFTDSAIRALTKRLAKTTGVVSFAGGMPSPATFPLDAFSRAFDTVMRQDGRAALQYGPSNGHAPLRAWIAETLSTPGARIAAEQVVVTSGSQQGLDLIGKLMFDAGDAVAVETPTYLGALQAFGQYGPRVVPIQSDDGGIVPEQLETGLRRAGVGRGDAKLLYTIPTFQNPTGRTLSHARRVALVEACAREDLPLVEDDPYGGLDYQGRTHTTLLSLDPARVIYLGSFSKILSPGIRLGYMVAPMAVAGKLEMAKQASDLHSSSLMQRVVHEIVKDGFLTQHLDDCRRLYRDNAAAMHASLERHLGGATQWVRAEGGMFLWLQLPDGLDAAALLEQAIAAGVAYVPGSPFYAAAPQANTLRLCFSTADATQIEQGIAALGRVMGAAR